MDEAKLIVVTIGKGADGFPVEVKEEIDICVLEEKSVTRTEFYEAMRSDVSLKLVLVIRQEDYELSERIVNGRKAYAEKIEYDSEIYDIKRTYKKNKSTIELMCG